MSKDKYRGQDKILEMIRATSKITDTWNEACEIIHDRLLDEGLTSSAEQALTYKQKSGQHHFGK